MENSQETEPNKFLDYFNAKLEKQPQDNPDKQKYAVMSTRVSSLDQLYGFSLEVQEKAIREYAERENIEIIASFGGTNESAKSDDERIEFDKMLKFIKKSKTKIDLILVHKIDRFSRSGPNAIYIKENLRKEGVFVQAVTQLVEVGTSIGDLQQNMQLVFAQYENEMRRDRCIDGTKAKLRNGGWPSKPPFGYIKVAKNKDKKAVSIIDQGKASYVNFIFESFVYNGLSQAEIQRKLAAMGVKKSPQDISDMLHNPFYCGYMRHASLKGEVVKGNHEPIISETLFMEAHKLLNQNNHGYKHKVDNNFFPLKQIVFCKCCGYQMTSYQVPYKNTYYRYYKCQKNCKNMTIRTEQMHDLFRSKLAGLKIEPALMPLIRKQLLSSFAQLTEVDVSNKKLLNTRLTEEKKKYYDLKMNLGLGIVPKDIFDELKPEFEQKISSIEAELVSLEYDSSKIEKYMDKALELASNILEIWELSDYKGRQRLNKLIFYKGLQFDPKNSEVLKGELNPLFACIVEIARNIENVKVSEGDSDKKNSGEVYYSIESSKKILDSLSSFSELSWELPVYNSTLSGTVEYHYTYSSDTTYNSSARGTMENTALIDHEKKSTFNIYQGL